ncbi:MAG: hypothetical protein HQM08_01145 [Candidatus Riflebacteria bacterium]|nr:hypothetical protein [Candidatus Riflebacteria bacterium]
MKFWTRCFFIGILALGLSGLLGCLLSPQKDSTELDDNPAKVLSNFAVGGGNGTNQVKLSKRAEGLNSINLQVRISNLPDGFDDLTATIQASKGKTKILKKALIQFPGLVLMVNDIDFTGFNPFDSLIFSKPLPSGAKVEIYNSDAIAQVPSNASSPNVRFATAGILRCDYNLDGVVDSNDIVLFLGWFFDVETVKTNAGMLAMAQTMWPDVKGPMNKVPVVATDDLNGDLAVNSIDAIILIAWYQSTNRTDKAAILARAQQLWGGVTGPIVNLPGETIISAAAAGTFVTFDTLLSTSPVTLNTLNLQIYLQNVPTNIQYSTTLICSDPTILTFMTFKNSTCATLTNGVILQANTSQVEFHPIYPFWGFTVVPTLPDGVIVQVYNADSGTQLVSKQIRSAPNAPTISSPSTNLPGVNQNPTFLSSSFLDRDLPNDALLKSRWEVYLNNISSPANRVWSGSAASTAIVIDAINGTFENDLLGMPGLAVNTHYWVRVCHFDTSGASSPWSDLVPFVTQEWGSTFSSGTIMSTKRSDGLSLVAGGVLYAIGGYDLTNSTSLDVEAFNPILNTWTLMTQYPRPEGRRGSGIAADANGAIYLFGGTNAYGTYTTRTIDKFNPTLNKWSLDVSSQTNVSSLPGWSGMACTTLGNSIYCFGGGNFSENATQSAYRFDPVAANFTKITPVPAALTGSLALPIGTKILLFGGYDKNSVATSSVYQYDTVADSWSYLTGMPASGTQLLGGVFNGKVYLFGGFFASGSRLATFTNPLQYDPLSNSWNLLLASPLPAVQIGANLVGLEGYFCGVVGNTAYFAGGRDHTGTNKYNATYLIALPN